MALKSQEGFFKPNSSSKYCISSTDSLDTYVVNESILSCIKATNVIEPSWILLIKRDILPDSRMTRSTLSDSSKVVCSDK